MSVRLEKLLALALILLAFFLVGRMSIAMATHSLSTDEFGTVGSFSAKGPAHVVTDYRAPKNHIFFNLLNSLLPGSDSLASVRVRALSIAATVLTALILVAWGFWRGRLLEMAALVALWASAPQALPLSMEARGYGFLGLFAVFASLAIVEYLRAPSPRWLAVLGTAVALGTWTVPGFLFFGGPLMLLLWMATRTRAAFLAGLLTFAAILVLYAPVLTQLVAAFNGFHQDKDEADFHNLHAVLRAAKLYLFQADDWESWTLLLLLTLAPFALPFREAPAALRLLVGAVVCYFGILLILRTPPLRIAAFALLPLGIAGLLALGGWLRTTAPSVLRISATALAGIFLVSQLAAAARTFDFTPTENWSLAGRAIDTAFPPTMKVDYKRFAKYLQKTLADPAGRQADFDPVAFEGGQLVVADASNKWAERDSFVPPQGLSGVVEWRIPGTIRDIVLTFRLPASREADHSPLALTDGKLSTGLPLDGITLRAEGHPHAAILLLDRPAKSGGVTGAPGLLVAGNAIVIPHPSGDIHLRAAKNSPKAVEAWLTR